MNDPPISERKGRLSETKQALLEQLLGRRPICLQGDSRTSASGLPDLEPSPENRYLPFPLTDIQQAYWIGRNGFFELGNVGSHSYIELELSEFDEKRFERALGRLIERHEMLRAIVQTDGRQRILPEVPPYPVRVFNLSDASSGLVIAHIEAVRRRLTHQVMAPEQWPLFEICATQLTGGSVRLHISFDILIADVKSVRILTRDLAAFYNDVNLVLPPIEVSFRDYVLADRKLKETELYARSKDYWNERLLTLPPAPDLPIRSLKAVSRPQFTRLTSSLDRELWQRLQEGAIKAGVTPSAAVLAAFGDTLSRWTESPRFTLNLTLYNRLPFHPQVNELVGDFTSSTLLGLDYSLPGTLLDHARNLQSQLWKDLDHRYFSGVEVLRKLAALGKDRTRAIMPVVFTSNMTMEVEPEVHEPLGKFVYGLTQTPQVWLDHQVAQESGNLVFNWDAVEDLFTDGLLITMFNHYQNMLQDMALAPEGWLRKAEPKAGLAVTIPARRSAHEKVLSVVEDVLDVRPINDKANLLDLGASSIDIIRIANALENEFNFRPDMEQFFQLQTVADITDLYEGRTASDLVSPASLKPGGEILLDPVAREDFKNQEFGLRGDLVDQMRIDLVAGRTPAQLLIEPRTYREYASDPISFDRFCGLLACLRRLTLGGKPKYAYGSAGGLYPVQTYLHVKPGRIDSVGGGIHYYHPAEHSLIILSPGAELSRKLHGWINRSVFDKAAFSIFLVADDRAIRPMYGRLSHDFCIHEAGSMSQLLRMTAPTYRIGLCSIGHVEFEQIRGLFALDEQHVLLHTLLGGPIGASQDRAAAGLKPAALADVARTLERVEKLSLEERRALLDERRRRGDRNE